MPSRISWRPAGKPHPLPGKNWHDLVREEILEPDLPIIDAHHHIYHRPGLRYSVDDLMEDVGSGHNIRATVFVDCRAMFRQDGGEKMAPVGEVEFVNGIAAMSASGMYGPVRLCAGIVSWADLTLGAEVGDVLDAQMAAGGTRFRGIRFMTNWDPDPSLVQHRMILPERVLYDADFRAGFAQLGPRGLSFDALVFHPQMQDLIDLARAFPETRIVVNHVGGLLAYSRPYAARRDENIALWRASMAELARCPNVFIKLGGRGMPYLGHAFDGKDKPPTSQALASSWEQIIRTCVDLFGPDHCLFESNFPADKPSCSYPVLWNAFKRIAAAYSPEEKQELFYGTAVRAYKLSL